MAKMVLDWINLQIAIESSKIDEMTYEEWCYIRRNGTPEEIAEAVERMILQGGYDCLA